MATTCDRHVSKQRRPWSILLRTSCHCVSKSLSLPICVTAADRPPPRLPRLTRPQTKDPQGLTHGGCGGRPSQTLSSGTALSVPSSKLTLRAAQDDTSGKNTPTKFNKIKATPRVTRRGQPMLMRRATSKNCKPSRLCGAQLDHWLPSSTLQNACRSQTSC